MSGRCSSTPPATLGTAYRRSVDDMTAALRHPDLKEGLAAFRERRPPDFLADR